MKAIKKFLLEKKMYSIYLDMDGVITNFRDEVHDLGYGTIAELEAKGESVLWSLIAKKGVSFWSNMKWMPDGKKLWSFVKHFNPTILSAPAKMDSSKIGKRLWISKNLGKNVPVILIKAQEKQLYANANSILIDDDIRNTDRWKLAGGIAITHVDADNTITHLKDLLRF